MIAWLLLLGFGLGGTVFNGELNLCEHGDGTVRLEWGACANVVGGACAAECRDHDGDDSDTPCRDTVLKRDGEAAGLARLSAIKVMLPPAPLLAIVAPVQKLEPTWSRFSRDARWDRPPDGLKRLKTVIRIV